VATGVVAQRKKSNGEACSHETTKFLQLCFRSTGEICRSQPVYCIGCFDKVAVLKFKQLMSQLNHWLKHKSSLQRQDVKGRIIFSPGFFLVIGQIFLKWP